MNSNDKAFLLRSLDLARSWEGFTGENPPVGAVLVKGNKVLSEAVHRGSGKPHAEREAIRKAISRFGASAVKGATLYVSLEPCSSWGRTPPCTEIIKNTCIKRVVFGSWDPNPKNRKGVLSLLKEGIKLDWPRGNLAKEFKRFYRPFDVFINQKRPFVIVKIAQTLNGFIVDKNGQAKWITSPKTRRLVHCRLRRRVSGLMTGIGTILADDPQLNVRGVGQKNVLLRIILDPELKTPIESQVLKNSNKMLPVLILVSEQVAEKRIRSFISSLKDKGGIVQILKMKEREQKLNLYDVLKEVGRRMNGMYLLVEAGPRLVSDLFRCQLVDRLVVCISKSIIGAGRTWLELEEVGLQNRLRLESRIMEDLGEDIWVEFDVCWDNKTH